MLEISRNTYKGLIKTLKENQFFVFGSNVEGRHGKGAANQALTYFGAIYGQSIGFQGNSYGICTKDLRKKIHPSVSKNYIMVQILKLYEIAEEHPELEFFIAYKDAINYNCYTSIEMAEMFSAKSLDKIPENIIFEYSFNKLMLNIYYNDRQS